MRRLGRVVGTSFIFASLVGSGCGFDSQTQPGEGAGLGEAEDDDDSGRPPGDTSVPEPESPPGDDGDPPAPDPDDGGDETTGNDTADPSSDGDGDGDGDGDSGDGDGDSGESEGADCDEPFAEIWWAEDADLEAPMELIPASSAQGEPMFAKSEQQDEGIVAFNVDVPCAGEYYAWGLVWDLAPGAYGVADPDSFYVDAGGPEVTWRYGCQTGGLSRAVSWQRVQSLVEQPCDVEEVVVSLDAPGEHAVAFRNREPGYESGVAAIGAVVISNDPDFDPYELYEPYAD